MVLKANGTLDDLKARLRAEAFFAKDDKVKIGSTTYKVLWHIVRSMLHGL